MALLRHHERRRRACNSALGNFTGLSPFEQNYVRTVFPFYAWYRAITGVVAKLPAERPATTALLARVGQQGAQQSLNALGLQAGEAPDYAQGFIPLGAIGSDGRLPALSSGVASLLLLPRAIRDRSGNSSQAPTRLTAPSQSLA